jgi:hypothetical protein
MVIAIIRLEKKLMNKEICKKYETKISMEECCSKSVFIRLQNEMKMKIMSY